MRFAGHFIARLALAMVLAVSARAVSQDVPGNPYLTVAARNVFALLPIPTNNPADSAPPPEPPPKITPNGIMTLFGKLQVLFKVAVKPPPGQPAKDQSYVMTEGERQDEIEVVKINQNAGSIIFNNHGTVQELALVAATASGPASAPPPPAMGGIPIPIPRFNSSGGAGNEPVSIGRPFGGPSGPGGRNHGYGGSYGGNVGSIGNMSNTSSSADASRVHAPQMDVLTPEAQVIMMEAQRAEFLDKGSSAASILPPTPLTHLVTGDGNGGENVPAPPLLPGQ